MSMLKRLLDTRAATALERGITVAKRDGGTTLLTGDGGSVI